MKNREYRVLLALALTASLTVSALGLTPADVYAKEPAAKITAVAEADSSKSAAASKKDTSDEASSSAKPFKEETVYAKIGADGSVNSITVSDQLKNITDETEIHDVSTLNDIENVKGSETFSHDSQKLMWDGAGKDICYQGTTDQSLPVGVKITYTLDGKAVSANELEGKSGHLVIRYQYENTTGDSNKEYSPFLMVTGLILDTDSFTNVTVTNGKLVSDGDRDLAIGMGLPGMQSYLGVSDLDIPDYFEVEADVTDYAPVEGITVAANSIFNDLDTDGFDDLSELEDSFDALQNAADQLVDGSGELKSGLDTLLSSSGTLVDGIDRLLSGTGELNTGASELNAGLAQAADIASNTLLNGAIELDDGVTAMQNQLSGGMAELKSGVQALDSGLNTVQPGASLSIADGSASLNAVLNSGTEATGGVSAVDAASATATGAQKLYTTLTQAVNAALTPASDVVAAGNTYTSEAISTLQSLLESPDSTLSDADRETIANAIGSLQTAIGTYNAYAQATDEQLQTQNQQLAESAGQLADGTSGVSQIIEGAADGAAALNSGIQQVASGAHTLNEKITNPDIGLIAQVNSGVSTLKAGTSALRDGIGGEKGLVNGLNQLSDGAESLNSGAGTLSDGILSLKNGSGDLIDGVQQLADGAAELNDGMIQFNEEGIQKLVSAFDGDIEGLLDKLNHMMDASRNYKNFSGISEDMDGEVHFIFVTNK